MNTAVEQRCANCGISSTKRPMKYREGDELFCTHDCMLKLWGKRAVERAEKRGLCGRCWGPIHPQKPCAPWVVRRS